LYSEISTILHLYPSSHSSMSMAALGLGWAPHRKFWRPWTSIVGIENFPGKIRRWHLSVGMLS